MTTEERKEKARERVRLWRLKNPDGWKDYYQKNADRLRSKTMERYWKNHEKSLDYAKKYRENHREIINENFRKKYVPSTRKLISPEVKRAKNNDRAKSWYLKNPERVKERARKWCREHKEVVAEMAAARRRSTPPWVNRKEIRILYKSARQMSIEQGIKYHVDHIWPIKGKGFTGLHVLWNLRIITATENQKKGNRSPI